MQVRAPSRLFFPKLGADLSLSPSLIGIVASTAALGRLLTFAVLADNTRWQYCAWLLGAAPFASAAGMVLAATGNTVWLFVPGFFVTGAMSAITYTSSLFYSLAAPENTGTNAGIHESLLSTGLMTSALFGGLAAQTWGLKSPFMLSSVLLVAGGMWVFWRLRRVGMAGHQITAGQGR